jgi:hypothetical protein
LIYVGTASPAVLQHIDVKGKIAVQLIVPQGHMVFERGPVVSRDQDLIKRGAVAVFNIVRCPATSWRATSTTAAACASTSEAATASSWRACSIASRRPAWTASSARRSR